MPPQADVDWAVLALDLGGTQVRAAIVRGDGTIVTQRRSRTPVEGGGEAIVQACLDTPLAERARASLGLPAFLDRDTQVAALGEGAFGAARGCADYLYLTVSTGIGGAIVSGGNLLRGPDGTAGELGHLLVDRHGPACGWGAVGPLEAIASRWPTAPQ